MSVTTRHQGAGQWDLTLRPDTPNPIMQVLNPMVSLHGHVVVTQAPVDIAAMSDADALSLSVFTGRLLEQTGAYEFGGDHITGWLGTGELGPQKTSDAAWGADGFHSTNVDSFAEWAAEFTRGGLSAGIVGSIAGTYTKTFPRTHMLEAMRDVCSYFGAEYRVTEDGKLDMGTPAQLFTMDPRAVIVRRDGGRDLNMVGVTGDLRVARSGRDWRRTERYWYGDSDSPSLATVDGGVLEDDVPYRAFGGDAAEIMHRVEDYSNNPGVPTVLATAEFNKYKSVEQQITLSTPLFDISGDVRVGDMVNVFDPSQGLMDLSNPVVYRGQTIYPAQIRAVGFTRPVLKGMGVYFRVWRWNGSSWVVSWTDLTRHVAFETGSTTVEVGVKPRRLR